MGTIIALGMFAVTASASPWIAAFMNHKLEAQRRKWALERIQGEPFIYEGARLFSLQEPGRDSPVLENCTIKSLRLARVVLEDDYGAVTVFTVREFEKMIWVFDLSEAPA